MAKSLLKKYKKSVKSKLVLTAEDTVFEKDIYVQSIKQKRLIWWMGCLQHIGSEIDRSGESHHLILEAGKLINALILMSSFFEDGRPVGNFQDEDDVEILDDLLSSENKKKILKAICKMHKQIPSDMLINLINELETVSAQLKEENE